MENKKADEKNDWKINKKIKFSVATLLFNYCEYCCVVQ